MRRALGSCAVVDIGPDRQSVKDESGARLLDYSDDWVRLEGGESLRRERPRVMPMLVGGASMPKVADLPEAIAAFELPGLFDLCWRASRPPAPDSVPNVAGIRGEQRGPGRDGAELPPCGSAEAPGDSVRAGIPRSGA